LQFVLVWRKHEIKGKGSYLIPWKRITAFANRIAFAIGDRFPAEEFLKGLDVVVPEEWRKAHDSRFYVRKCTIYFRLIVRMEAAS
jgi:hypothetical protein